MPKTSIKKNFAYQMAYEALTLLLPLFTSPYIARVLGAEGLGQYSYSYSVAYYFVLFSMLGVMNHGRRSIAQVRDDPDKVSRTFSAILADHVLVSVICCAVYAAYAFTRRDDRIYALMQGAYVLSGLFDISWFYFGLEKFKLTALRSSAIKLLMVACIFIFIKNTNDLWKYCLIMAAGTLLSQLMLWLSLHRHVHIVRPALREMLAHVRPLLILFIPSIAVSIYKNMDKVMIGILSSKTALGYYENAEKIINIPNAVIAAFGAVMMPKMSYLAAKGDLRNAEQYMLLSMRYVMCFAFALTFGIAGVGQTFAPLFWGKAFLEAGDLIVGLAVTIPFISFANVIRTQYLLPQAKDMLYNFSLISGAVVNLIINRLLIPRMGAMGAVFGTIAAEGLVCIIQVVSVRKALPIITYLKNALPFALFGMGMYVLVYRIGAAGALSWQTLFLQIAAGAIVYSAMCSIYFWINRDDIVVGIFAALKKK